MKKLLLVVCVALGFFACNNTHTETMTNVESKDTTAVIAGAIYTCPMHPEITSDKPGTCSKCGMDLEAKTEAPADTTQSMAKDTMK